MSLTAAEREAVLTYDEETDMYHIFCSSSKEQTRMRKAGFEPYKTDSDGSSYYKVERKQISFKSKGKKREWTEEQRRAAAERLAKARQSK
ncbi:hypothetical protein [Paenibacillus sp. XY044]|uniref:hypothetical protein n=1 Tax=Paenibacillus sp. XY044 TaxID=2026089 RepID=UPI000B9979F5|nr:hypothetical protein [Paenibacillus sp. XY044]OZB98092.1 hypothetical protein CJP46_02690 [Paenibacillus sp. XY044]